MVASVETVRVRLFAAVAPVLPVANLALFPVAHCLTERFVQERATAAQFALPVVPPVILQDQR